MRDRYCFWSVTTGPQAAMMRGLVDSARAVGVFKDFHVWSDRPIPGTISHDRERRTRTGGLFILEFLHRAARKLPYEYFVWLDPDSYFVRSPGNLLRVLEGAPVHASLESDLAATRRPPAEWNGCSLTNLTTLMRFCGVRSRSIFTVDGGFWVVHREVIETFCDLAWEFRRFCEKVNYRFRFEPLLAYAVQMLCGNPYAHTLRRTAEVWAPDRAGCYAGRLPDGQPWEYEDEFTGERYTVNPAIVHAGHSHRALLANARRRRQVGAAPDAPPD